MISFSYLRRALFTYIHTYIHTERVVTGIHRARAHGDDRPILYPRPDVPAAAAWSGAGLRYLGSTFQSWPGCGRRPRWTAPPRPRSAASCSWRATAAPARSGRTGSRTARLGSEDLTRLPCRPDEESDPTSGGVPVHYTIQRKV